MQGARKELIPAGRRDSIQGGRRESLMPHDSDMRRPSVTLQGMGAQVARRRRSMAIGMQAMTESIKERKVIYSFI